VANWLMCT